MNVKVFHLLTALTLVVGIALRVLGIRGELWLDELWSLDLVSGVSNPLDLIVKVHHDNNHPLNSVWIWLVGGAHAAWLYRLPALLFSSVTLILLARNSKNDWSRFVWLILCAVSFMLTLYGSEARGYSLAILCAVGVYLLGERLVTERDTTCKTWIAVVATIGVFSHGIFLLAVGALSVWLFYLRMYRPELKIDRTTTYTAAIVPLVVAAGMMALFYGNLTIGGAPNVPYAQVAASTLMVAFGGPEISLFNIEYTAWWLLGACVIAGCCLTELVSWIKSRDPMALLAALNIFVPVAAILLTMPSFILSRYFLISILFLYLLYARFLVRLAQQGIFGTVLAIGGIAIFVVGNGNNLVPLLSTGRAHYKDAAEWMASTEGAGVTVGGENDFQNQLRLKYLRTVSSAATTITYVSQYEAAEVPPKFVIREAVDQFEELPERMATQNGATYALAKRYPAPIFSGARWFIYKRNE